MLSEAAPKRTAMFCLKKVGQTKAAASGAVAAATATAAGTAAKQCSMLQ